MLGRVNPLRCNSFRITCGVKTVRVCSTCPDSGCHWVVICRWTAARSLVAESNTGNSSAVGDGLADLDDSLAGHVGGGCDVTWQCAGR